MRITEVIVEGESGEYANIATTLSLLQNRINTNELKPQVSTQLVIKYIQNSGLKGFTYADLLAANEADSTLQNIVKDITPQTVTFVTDTGAGAVNPEDGEPAEVNPQQKVSQMAKQASKRRQKPLF
jgi:hypothetical protein